MNGELLSILVCPACREKLIEKDRLLRCGSCGEDFRIVNGIPVFLREPVEVVPVEHESNALGPQFEEVLKRGQGLTLHLGAGATARRHRNCVEFEHKIFRHTDVVGDAHALPFPDNVFDQVFAFNVFEHLRHPALAASEIRRVLKPGGSVAIHTAFLQALHEEPSHFYNATEYGVREWFAGFEIEKCEVSGNFSPGVMLGYLTASLLETVRQSGMPATAQIQIAETRLGEWADFWNRRSEPPPGFAALLALPQEFQKRVSAGFELLARKPGTAP
jgi:uncharacterized protein YbaR (Trm112 family)/predicted SAM-dependent methyltransferase